MTTLNNPAADGFAAARADNRRAVVTIYVYNSPLRPLDSGYAAREAGVEIDWDHTDIGPGWTPAKRYAFSGPLPEFMIEQMTLVLAEPERAS